jgi:sulfate transport system substrate-binding protein
VVKRSIRVAGLLGPAVLLAATLGGCGGAQRDNATKTPAQGQGGPLLLVSYSVTKSAYDRILPKFQADWKRRTGADLEVKTSYGGSGSQSRAVIDGLDADLVTLALPADVLKLEQAGLVQPGWEKELPNESAPAIPRGSAAGPTWPGLGWGC